MAKEKNIIQAEVRTVLGRKVKKIRKEGLIPASVYGNKFEPMSVQFKALELERLYDDVGESGLVELSVDSEKLPILFRNAQYSAVEGNLIHIDCYKVNLREKITAFVPVEFTGESQAVKNGNLLMPITDELEVEALPANLPESIMVDISVLNEVDDMITAGDIKLEDKVAMITQADQVIVKIEVPKIEEEAPTEEAAPGEVPAMNQKSEEEKAEKKEE